MSLPEEEAPSAPDKSRGETIAKEAVWRRITEDAQKEADNSSVLTPLYAPILTAHSFEEALAGLLAGKLSAPALPARSLTQLFFEAARKDPSIGVAACADLMAIVERDPATDRFIDAFLYFNGFAAIASHRLGHWLWQNGKPGVALYLQCRSSEVSGADIHPAAQLGKGIFLDHATGFVAGETVVIEDDVSILHRVTLGGGAGEGDRHPKIRTGVLIGAAAIVTGNIEIGAYSRIAAGSLVVEPVPARCTAVGVPARIVEGAGSDNPAKTMNQALALGTYESFNYTI